MTTPDNPKQQTFDLEPGAPAPAPAPATEPESEPEPKTELIKSEAKASEPEIINHEIEGLEPEIINHETREKVIIEAPTESHVRSNKETREVVTPYAFTVSPDLLGLTLATPARRGFAMLIDLFFIAVLSTLSALFLAGFVALTFFKAGDRLKKQKRFNMTRLGLRGAAAILIFSIIFVIVADMGESDEPPISQIAQEEENSETMRSLLDLAAQLGDESCQGDTNCFLKFAEAVAVGAAAMSIPVEDIKATTSDIVSQKNWSDENKSLFMDTFINTLNEERNAYTDDVLEITQSIETKASTGKIYNVLAWAQDTMSDLGLSLGWAALYFSVFTAWWRGQTIGKKMLGIEVVKLDGNYPSLWESFGRYGGYSAGFATGLSGFLQVYWDPNRQAIQDKISETLVLRLKPKKTTSFRKS